MSSLAPFCLRLSFSGFAVACMGGALFAATFDEPAEDSKDVSAAATVTDAENSKTPEDVPRVSVAVARDRAKLLHEVYVATLHVMHDRYFHSGRLRNGSGQVTEIR